MRSINSPLKVLKAVRFKLLRDENQKRANYVTGICDSVQRSHKQQLILNHQVSLTWVYLLTNVSDQITNVTKLNCRSIYQTLSMIALIKML